MPAAVRGGSRVEARPRAKAAPKSAQRPQLKAAPALAKPRAPKGSGPSPKLILIAAAALLAAAGVAVLATGHRGERMVAAAQSAVDGKFGQAGFRLRKVRIEGASAMATGDIVKAAGVYKDEPLLGLDLPGMRKRIEAVGWVKEAHIVRLLPDTLVISVAQRRQLAVWQHE